MNTKAYDEFVFQLSKLGLDFEADYSGDGTIVFDKQGEVIDPLTLPKQVQVWLTAYDTLCQHNNCALDCFDCEVLSENSATQAYPVGA